MSGQFQIATSRNIANIIQGELDVREWVKIIVLSGIAFITTLVVYKAEVKGAVILIGTITGVPIVLSCLWNERVAISILIFLAFFLSAIGAFFKPPIPMGLLIDFIVLLGLVGIAFRLQFERRWDKLKTPMTTILLCWMAWNIVQIANPSAASRVAYFYVIRPAIGYPMLFFFIWHTTKSPKDLSGVLDFLLFFVAIAALWGVYHKFFGYFDWELAAVIHADSLHLVFNHGRFRSFGPMTTSPAQYGIVMAAFSVIALNVGFATDHFFRRSLLVVIGVLCLLAMIYSGTRAAYVIPPVFFVVKASIARKKHYYVLLGIMFVGIIVLANVPTNNYSIQRIQSIFKASEDASYQTRKANKARIMPFILSHPLGGGLGSTGVWGMRFSPGTYLSGFAPDSGIMRVVVELGWPGLGIFLGIYGVAFFRGYIAYRTMQNRSLRAMTESIIGLLPAFGLVEYGQEVFGVFPMSLLFWVMLALCFLSIKYDRSDNVAG